MTLSRRQFIGLAAAGGLVGFPKIADLVVNSQFRDPFSWDAKNIPATDLQVARILDFREFADEGWGIFEVAAGPAQDLLVLLGKVHWNLDFDPKRQRRPWQDRRNFRFDGPRDYRIVHQQRDGSRDIIDLRGSTQDYWWLQPLLHEEYLLIGEWSEDDYNSQVADVFDDAGNHIRSFDIGSGVDEVQTTSNGHIWVGYYDGGVYSDDNFGQAGVACFDQDGNVQFEFNTFALSNQSARMSYFDAMNVQSDGELWLFYETEDTYRFESPLIQIKDRKIVSTWRNIERRAPVVYADLFAIDTDRLLFGGVYDDFDGLYLVPLSGESFRKYRPLANGKPIELWTGFARGSWFYLWSDFDLYGIDVSTLPPLT